MYLKKGDMNEKILSTLLALLFAISFLPSVGTRDAIDSQTIQQEQLKQTLSSKIRYFYNSAIEGSSIMTTNNREFYDNVSDSDQVIVVFELNNKPEFLNERLHIDDDASHEEARNIRREYHNKLKEYYQKVNAEFLRNNAFVASSKDYTITQSQYSPFVQIEFADYATYRQYNEKIVTMAADEEINNINIGVPENFAPEADRVDASAASSGFISVGVGALNAYSQTYAGAGTKVGIIEPYGVAFSTSHEELDSLPIYTYPQGAPENWHAIRVARVLCGENGMARDVDAAYIAHSPNPSYFLGAVEYLIACEVDVINISMSSPGYYGQYTWQSALIDYYVRFLYVPFVCAAGNYGNDGISSFGASYNAITVANSTLDNDINMGSAYGFDIDINNRKPTVSAPGTNIYFDFPQSVEASSGTSYSAPYIAGIVAKLICEFPALRACPDTTIAALIASAEPVNGQSIGQPDVHAGAGVVNYAKAREAVLNASGFACHIDFSNKNVKSTTEAFPADKRIKIVAVWLTNSNTQAEDDEIEIDLHTNYNLQISHATGVVTTASTQFNYEYISFFNDRSGEWTLKLIKAGEKHTDYCDWGTVTWVSE